MTIWQILMLLLQDLKSIQCNVEENLNEDDFTDKNSIIYKAFRYEENSSTHLFTIYCRYQKQYNKKRNVDANAITITIEISNAKRFCPSLLILVKSHLNFSIIFVVTFTVSL